jgi:hypothetical protein
MRHAYVNDDTLLVARIADILRILAQGDQQNLIIPFS